MDTKAQRGYLLINRSIYQLFSSRLFLLKKLIAHMQDLIAAENAGRAASLTERQPAYGN